MAELVGGALLSSFLQVLFERLAPKDIPKLFRGKQPIEDVLREVRSVVKSVTRLVNDAEEKQISDDDVKEWLDELNDVVYRADDLLDTINTEALRLKMEPHQPSSSNIINNLFTTGFDDMVKNEATEILRSFKSVLQQKDDLGLREGLREMPPSQRPPTPLAEESSVYGRKGDKEAIIDLLLSSDGIEENLSVIPIVGMGGIGKTTLAQLIYDDATVKDRFDLRAWVTISDDFDIYKITKTILEKVTSQECRSRELLEIQQNLREALRGKKFLLIHDDVWNENYQLWDCLKSSFESGAEGSKIIVTTRSTVVASVMASGKTTFYQLTDLSPEECWMLFSRYAFRNNEDAYAHQDLQSIGRDIVKKCKGLPLAIKSIGGLLRSERNPTKWENILKSDVWNELYGTKKNILPALWLSYRRMPTHLKRCFSYCATFPKDYEFKRERIILMWMAEGFLQSNNKSMTMEEVGEACLKELEILWFDSVVSVGDELYGSSTSGTSFKSLETLKIWYMPQWKEWSFGGDGTLVFPRLKILELVDCPELKEIMRLPNSSDACHVHPDSLSKLEELYIHDCKKVLEWDIIHRLPALKVFLIMDWEGDSFPGDGMLLPTTLAKITILNSINLKTLNGEAFQQLTNLKELYITFCPQLQSLPKEGLPPSLSSLRIYSCHPLLKQRCEKDKGEDWHKIAHIPQVYISSIR